MMLGEIAVPTSVQIGGWLFCLFALVGGMNQLLKLTDRMKEKPPAGEVRAEAAQKYMMRSECSAWMTQHQDVHKDLFKKVGGMERGWNDRISNEISQMRAEHDKSSTTIHTRLNEFERSIGKLESATELQNQSLAQIQTQLGRMSQRGLRGTDI